MNVEVLKFIQFALDNNQLEISKAMFNEHIIVNKGEDIKAVLYKLFERNREKFIKILKEAGFNIKAKNYTTSNRTLKILTDSYNAYKADGKDVSKVEFGNETSAAKWYDSVLGALAGGSESSTTTTTTSDKPATGTQTKIIAVSLLAIGGISILIYFLTK